MDLIVFINYTHYCHTVGKRPVPAIEEDDTEPVFDYSGWGATPTPTFDKPYGHMAKTLNPELWDRQHVTPGLVTWLVHGPLSDEPCSFVDPNELKVSAKKGKGNAAQNKKEAAKDLAVNQLHDPIQGNNPRLGGTLADMARMGVAVSSLQTKDRAASIVGFQSVLVCPPNPPFSTTFGDPRILILHLIAYIDRTHIRLKRSTF